MIMNTVIQLSELGTDFIGKCSVIAGTCLQGADDMGNSHYVDHQLDLI